MNRVAGQPQTIKKVNSNLVFQLIFEHGPISKPELAEKSKLSLPTVNNLVDALEKGGEVRACGQSTAGVGRKATLYVANGKFGNFLSLFFSGNRYLCTVSDVVGKTVWKGERPVFIESGEAAFNDTLAAIEEMIGYAKEEVKAIGLGVPGVVTQEGILHSITSIEDWNGLPIWERIESKTGIETFVENDVKLMTVGYYYRHLKALYQNVAYIFVGRGLGSGLILNGRLYTGRDGFAGEYAYMMAEAPTEKTPAYADNGGFLEKEFSSLLHGQDTQEAAALLNNTRLLCNKLTFIAVNFISMLNPQAIVFGGNYVCADMIETIKKDVARFIPSRYVPAFYHDNGTKSGTEGIFRLCFANTSAHTHMRLVEDVGL